MSFQAVIDYMNAQWKKERAATQLTLGKLISELEDRTGTVQGFKDVHSYRGYYCDLSLEPSDKFIPVEEALAILRSAMGKTFTGYKGGDNMMGDSTPLWYSYYGSCGSKIMAVNDDGSFELEEDN